MKTKPKTGVAIESEQCPDRIPPDEKQTLPTVDSPSAGSVASMEPHPKRGYYGNHYSENEVFPIWDEDGNAIELA